MLMVMMVLSVIEMVEQKIVLRALYHRVQRLLYGCVCAENYTTISGTSLPLSYVECGIN